MKKKKKTAYEDLLQSRYSVKILDQVLPLFVQEDKTWKGQNMPNITNLENSGTGLKNQCSKTTNFLPVA